MGLAFLACDQGGSMSRAITINRFFTIPVHELYGYFIDPVLLERWCAPEGMSLKISEFNARVGGHYCFKHSDGSGIFVAKGHFRKLIQNQLIQMVDDEILDPAGNLLGKKLACDVTFTAFGNGAGVMIRQSGFQNTVMAEQCELGWNQCFDKLQNLVKDSGTRQFLPQREAPTKNLN